MVFEAFGSPAAVSAKRSQARSFAPPSFDGFAFVVASIVRWAFLPGIPVGSSCLPTPKRTGYRAVSGRK